MAVNSKVCERCKKNLPYNKFLSINNIVFPDGYTPICAHCLNEMLAAVDNDWQTADRICQWLGIPFVPDNWVNAVDTFEDEAIEVYIRMYKEGEFDYIDWKSAYEYYKELEKAGVLEDNIALLSKAELRKLTRKWGEEYDEPQIRYLENLYQSILNDYGVSNNTQIDNIKKYCKLALLLDEKIRSEEDIDKTIKSLDAARKMANLDPKNIKDANDFGSVGELFAYLEKTDWLNKFYDHVDRDIVDKTMKDVQNWCKNLYINESSIPEDIQSRIEALKYADEMVEELNKIEDDGLDDEVFEDEEFNPEAGV